MAVVIETTLGDMTVDLFTEKRPRACLNFLKLCKMKYYNYNLFHTISRGFMAQTGDPTGTRNGGESIYGVLEGPLKRYFESEKNPRIKHTVQGLVSFVGNEEGMIGSQFFITLGEELTYLDDKHCVFGEVMEGLDVLELLNETICDGDDRPYKDVRITHMVILEDPFNDLKLMRVPSRSPSPNAERLQGGRIGADEDIDDTEGKTAEEIGEMLAEREAKARATILEMVGDLPDAEMAPPENVLFVCKLNPVTTDDDLEIIFSRFGKIKSCEVIRDKKTGDSLQYAFVEFEEQKSCEDAYFKMDNVLIDDRRIHVDFSQSVSKIKWHGKGRGVTTYDDKGRKAKDDKNDIGKGRYKNGDSRIGKDFKKQESTRLNDYKRDERSRNNDNHRREENRSLQDYSRGRVEYSRRKDVYSRGRNDYSRGKDEGSRRRTEYSGRPDKYSGNDHYSRKDDKRTHDSRRQESYRSEYSQTNNRYQSRSKIDKETRARNSSSDSLKQEDTRKKVHKKVRKRSSSSSSSDRSKPKKSRKEESSTEEETKGNKRKFKHQKSLSDDERIEKIKRNKKSNIDKDQRKRLLQKKKSSSNSSSSDEGQSRTKNVKKKKKKRRDSSSSEEDRGKHRKHKKSKRKKCDSDSS